MADVHEVLAAALREVEMAGIPAELRVAAFVKAIELLGGAPANAREPGFPPREVSRVSLQTEDTDGATRLDMIAQRLGLDVEMIRDVFDVRGDGEMELIVAAGKFDHRKSVATKDIALLIVAGRQAAGIEDWTSVNRIREVCEQYKRLDSPNFSSSIREMDNLFTFRNNSDPRKREVRMSRPAWDKASELIVRLVEGGEDGAR